MHDNDGPCAGLVPLRLSDRPFIHDIFSQQADPISDYSFACTFIWSASLKIYWKQIHRHLCIFANGTGDLTLLCPPLPEPGADADGLAHCLRECFGIMDGYNDQFSDRTHSRIEYVSEASLARMRASPGFDLQATPMSADYVYDMARMIDLAGGPLQSKRSARARFMRRFPDHRTEPLRPEHRQACVALLLRWQKRVEEKFADEPPSTESTSPSVLRRREVAACEFALDSMDALGLKGLALFVGSELVGFTLGEALTSRQASVLIEKTHPDFVGAPQYIFSEFCRQCWADFPECNAGDDCGMPSLQFTKETYRPIRRSNKYCLTRSVPAVLAPTPGAAVPAICG
jgi:uncharacterized protein